MPDMSKHSDVRGRRSISAPRPAVAASPPTPDDRFFRRIVDSMRNGVIAIHRDGSIALMNDEAYRIFALTPRSSDVGRPFMEVLHDRADIVRVLAGAFALSTLPNRAELRLKDLARVLGAPFSEVK